MFMSRKRMIYSLWGNLDCLLIGQTQNHKVCCLTVSPRLNDYFSATILNCNDTKWSCNSRLWPLHCSKSHDKNLGYGSTLPLIDCRVLKLPTPPICPHLDHPAQQHLATAQSQGLKQRTGTFSSQLHNVIQYISKINYRQTFQYY